MAKYTKKEILELSREYGYAINNGDNELNNSASEFAGDYDYESDTLDAEEAVHDAFIYGAIWAIEHLEEN